ncbi:transcription factor TFIIIC complex subunit [Seiridium cupressi]
MRTRKSNRGKRFHQQAYLAELGSSDEEDLQRVAKRQDDDSDEGFVNDPAEQEADDDDKFENAELSAASDPESEASSLKQILPPRRQRPSSGGGRVRDGEEGMVERAPGHVQQYPGDPSMKWTRSYAGPISRHVHLSQLCTYWYGDRDGFRKIVNSFVLVWTPYDLFPPKLVRESELKLGKTPWVAPGFWLDQEKKLADWYFNYLSTRKTSSQSQFLPQTNAERWFLPRAETELSIFMGPHNNQERHEINQGQVIPLSHHGGPIPKEDTTSQVTGGWTLDVGGITLSMDWAPRNAVVDQLLAMTVIPYSDQAFYQTPEEAPPEASLKQGSVQIWSVPALKDRKGPATFAKSEPHRVAALCFDGWGRAVRMQWCPVPLTMGNVIGLLAFLTVDGKVRVLEVKQSWNERKREAFGKRLHVDTLFTTDSTNNGTEEIREPLATFGLSSEYKTEITAFTWVNMNRIAVGHSDGSVALWSLYPCAMLQRHPVHSSPILDIKSGYPSHSFTVVTVPTGGVVTITDLNRPNAELVYVPNLLISFQPNLLVWSEHMRGFISLWSSSSPSNISLSFMPMRAWPQSRFVVAVSGQPTCMAMGSCHPYLLVGSTDGSLWLSNPFRRVFFFKKKHRKLKVFHHDYQALPAPVRHDEEGDQELPRGICRILHDFKPLENAHPRHDKSGVQMRQRHDAQKRKQSQKKGKKAKGKAKQEGAVDQSENVEPDSDLDPDFEGRGTGDMVNCDPLTRISAVAWNPNVEFSWWAAAAMASGLVRIMDLGEEQVSRKKDKDAEISEDAEEDTEDEFDEQMDGDVFEDGESVDEASDVSMEDEI